MASSRAKSLLVGRSEMGFLPSLAIGVGLFVAFLVTSLGYYLMLEHAVRGWPTLTEQSVLAFGPIEIAYADITWAVYFGMFAVALAAAGYAAMRNQGFFIAAFWATAPFLGYMVGATLYYSRFVYAGYRVGTSSGWALPVAFSLLYGVTMGLLGFFIGRVVDVIA